MAKSFQDRKPLTRATLTRAALTEAGRAAFIAYLDAMSALAGGRG